MTRRSSYPAAAAGLALTGALLAGCATAPSSTAGSAPRTSPATASRRPTSGSPPPTVASSTDAAGTVWLCAPGLAGDPCTGNLDATAVSADGSTTPEPARPAPTSSFDCFYVYPTVSTESSTNADLTVQSAETAVAVEQAARFSSVCRVWAPMYRQRTASSLSHGLGSDPTADAVAYASLVSGWRDYLAHDNDGRPFIFIGHSQGAAMLIRLLRSQVDPDPSLRARMVSAIILGGNVEVPAGRDVGGSFEHIPACRSAAQIGCVIAYSSFPGPPPPDSLFGRPGKGVSLQSDQTVSAGMQVLCTNPAALGGGGGPLEPFFVHLGSAGSTTPVTTPWVAYPGLYSARCESSGTATWLQVDDVGPAGDRRPRVTESLGPRWGLHLDDVNIALGNLVHDVARQEAAYR